MKFLVILVFISTVVGLICYQKHPKRVFTFALLTLYLSSSISTDELINSFSNQGLITLMLLMVCSTAIEKTRVLRYVAKLIIVPSYNLTWIKIFGLATVSSSMLNNTAVVSTLLSPIRNSQHHVSSKLLIPLSYAAILGGTLTLVGTSTNLIVNSLVIEEGFNSLGFFDFTYIGLPTAACCSVVMYLMRNKLPVNIKKPETYNQYLVDYCVNNDSNLIGKTVEENGLRNLDSLFLVELLRGNHLIGPVAPYEVLQSGDRLIFSGDIGKIMQLQHYNGLSLFAEESGLPLSNMAEVLVRPESILVGNTIKSVGFRALFNAAVVAIKRDGESLSGKLGSITIQSGDFLVLATGGDFKKRKNINKNFIFLSGIEPESMLGGFKEWGVILGFLFVIFGSAFGAFSLFKGLLFFLSALVLSNSLSQADIIRRMPIDIWLIVSSALCLSQALKNSGAVSMLHDFFSHSDTLTPVLALILIYIATWLLTELVTNNAAAALMLPIAITTATSLDTTVEAFIMAVAFAASASFLSPYGYQTNLMVFNAGQYKINDFFRQGLPVAFVYGVVVIFMITFIYPLGLS